MATLVLQNPATIKENPISYSSIMGQFNHQQQFMAILFFQSINWLTF
jgi:hypothetical protein